MATWFVYHYIHVRTPHRTIPKLFITDVPDDQKVTWELVDEYREFGEFNTPHANHGIEKLTADSDPAVKRAWREGDVERVAFGELKRLRETV